MNPARIPILLVEDNPGDIFLVRRALAAEGLPAELTVAENGQAALRLIESAGADNNAARPQLVLLDLNLPGATGREVLKRIKGSPRCAKIPVIVMTSSDSPLDQEAVAQLGADCYFPKPTDLARYMRLGTIARGLLEKSGSIPSR